METEAMTLLIDPLEESDIERDKRFILSKIKNRKSTGKYKGADVYYLGDSQNGYVALAKNDQLLYFVRHESVRHNKLPLGRQVMVWSAGSAPGSAAYASTGFAAHVFFDYLLPKYKALIADKQQTDAGFRFWKYAINRALQEHKYVYFLNRRSTPNQLIRLQSDEDVEKYAHQMWGFNTGHLLTFAIISKIPLVLK
jgi:hypothetical protein